MSTATYIYFCQHHTPSGQSRVYRVAQLRTDGVHCRESVGTVPAVLKVARVTRAAFASPWTKCYCAPLFSHTQDWYTVFSSHSFWTSSSLDVPAGVTQEEGHTGFFIQLLCAVRALIFFASRIQPFLSLVDREVDF